MSTSEPRRRGRPRPALGHLAAALIVAGAAVAVERPAPPAGPQLRLAATTTGRALTLENSREGEAVVSAAGLVPGQAADGSVVLSNTGQVPARLTLDATDVIDRPGPGGGALSDRLRVTVSDAEGEIFTGPVRDLRAVSAGLVPAGARHAYAVRVAFPDGGAGDDAVQAAATSFALRWDARPGGAATPTATLFAGAAGVTGDIRVLPAGVTVAVRCGANCSATAVLVTGAPRSTATAAARRCLALPRKVRAVVGVPANERRCALGWRTRRFATGGARRLRVRPDRRIARTLAARRRVRVTLITVVRDAAGSARAQRTRTFVRRVQPARTSNR